MFGKVCLRLGVWLRTMILHGINSGNQVSFFSDNLGVGTLCEKIDNTDYPVLSDFHSF